MSFSCLKNCGKKKEKNKSALVQRTQLENTL